jgi:predicted 3-demethylubiquinone-9 3-methyltransferase (glyoxalase superfamily)
MPSSMKKHPKNKTIKSTHPQKITPHLWFDNKAKEAAEFYVSVFPDSKITNITTLYDVPTPSGETTIVSFKLLGQPFMAISAGPLFKFNESISFIIPCDTQEEIDYYWEKLSANPKAEQCGWLKDKFGLSWQVWPTILGKMMRKGKKDQITRVTKEFLQMKKFDIARLREAYKRK